jgi:hypothetical protein
LPSDGAKTEFYQHDAHWANRMILGDSLAVMASLAEREGLRGKVQCIYFDPPYGIKFNSNFQWSTTSRDVKDKKADHITREPEQVKAFRDTWRDGIHSYLTYLRDRLTVARDLLGRNRGQCLSRSGMRTCIGCGQSWTRSSESVHEDDWFLINVSPRRFRHNSLVREIQAFFQVQTLSEAKGFGRRRRRRVQAGAASRWFHAIDN